MSKKRVLYFDCFSGISGDMILGALVDIGIDLDSIRKGLQGLGLKGYKIKSLRVKRNGISGTKVNVVTNILPKNHRHRSFNDIKNLINKSRLSKKVKTDSIEIFHRMAKAEAQVHRTTLNKIHFHEVGSLDLLL